MSKKLTIIFSIIVPFLGMSQGTFAPVDVDYYSLIDRYEIKSGQLSKDFHSSYKPYRREAIIDFLNSLDTSSIEFSRSDKFNRNYLRIDNWLYDSSSIEESEKPILKWFYKKKSDWYSVDEESFKLRVNPVVYFQGGKDNSYSGNLYLNTRGLSVEGMIDDKVGFYTFMADNQMVVPNYVENYAQQYHLPYQGFLKRISDSTGAISNTYDFFTARGYVTFNATKHIGVQFGHDRHFIGNGYRSMILSYNAPNYLFLKFTTKIWKIQYTNLFAEMNAESAGGLGDRVLQKKYFALHHLSWNATKNLNFGLWEAVPYGRQDGSIELQYINPIIFYRSVEQQIGSGDNAVIGADFKWNFLNHFSLYGQAVIDEFILGDFMSRNGSWTNKQAFQLGAKYIDAFGLKNLDLQLERNYARPYTYTHKDNFRNYTHNELPLAHPLGANFKEWVAIARYQPLERLRIEGRVFLVNFGADSGSANFGGNILLDYNTKYFRPDDLGHYTGQGISGSIRKLDLVVNYQLKHNLFLDVSYCNRMERYNLSTFLNSSSTIISAAVRWNINQRRHDF